MGRIVGIHLTEEGPLGVVEMPPLGLNRAARLSGIFSLPFRDNVVVRLDFEQSFENQWESLSRGLFEGEDFDVVIVYAQMSAVTLDMRLRQVIVQEGVVPQLRELCLLRTKIERPFHHAEGFGLIKHAYGDEITDLQNEALDTPPQQCLCLAYASVEENDLFLARQFSQDLFQTLRWCRSQLSEGAGYLVHRTRGFKEHDKIDGQRKEVLSPVPEIRDSVFDRCGDVTGLN